MNFIKNHWIEITAIAYALINVLNGVTAHWSEAKSKKAKVALFVTEVLSVVKSGGLKPPLVTANGDVLARRIKDAVK